MTAEAPVIERDLPDLRGRVAAWRRAGESVGVVPTMGALHDGHLSLVRAATKACDRVIVTIFVNPKQFNNPEDLANYPRTEHDDAEKLRAFGVDVIYVPDGDTMYPNGFSTTVVVDGLTQCMDGIKRPGHFEGVATVVSKLFLQTGADQAFFGEKDYQQLMVVTQMARDLDIPITVVGCPTVRERDGLAMSSRNLRLSEEHRTMAPALYAQMCGVAQALRQGQDVTQTLADAKAALGRSGFDEVEYLELRRAKDLVPDDDIGAGLRLFAAAWAGDVRLIDNIAIDVS